MPESDLPETGSGAQENEKELLDLVDQSGAIVGTATRGEVHGNPQLLHPVVHCAVRNNRAQLLLQLRSKDKVVQPGKWDLSVGGHVERGESPQLALSREMLEEVGVPADRCHPRPLYRYLWRTDFESELVYTFGCQWDGEVRRQESEVDALEFWDLSRLEQSLGSGLLTPNLEEEYKRLLQAEFFA